MQHRTPFWELPSQLDNLFTQRAFSSPCKPRMVRSLFLILRILIAWPWMLLKGHHWEPIRNKKSAQASSRVRELPITQPFTERVKTEISAINLWIPRRTLRRAAMSIVISRQSTTSPRSNRSRPFRPTSTQSFTIQAQISVSLAHLHPETTSLLSAEAQRKLLLTQRSREDTWSPLGIPTVSLRPQSTHMALLLIKDSAHSRVTTQICKMLRKSTQTVKNWSQPSSISRLKTTGSSLNPNRVMVTTFTTILPQEKSKAAK